MDFDDISTKNGGEEEEYLMSIILGGYGVGVLKEWG